MPRSLEVIFTTNQAQGAIPNGTRVKKINSTTEDTHGDGACAIVLGSIGPIYQAGLPLYGYFVRWDNLEPPVFIQGNRIKVAT